MKRIPTILVQIGLVVGALMLPACESGDLGGDGGNGNTNPLWVTIEQPSYIGTDPSVDLRGYAYCEACPPAYWSNSCGYADPQTSSIDVLWSNLSTGASGTTFHGIFLDCDWFFYQYLNAYSHFWMTTVPLEAGRNIIGITASGMGYSVTDTVSVYRDLTPPTAPGNVSATAVSAGRIDVAWDAATDDRGVSGYVVYRDGAYIWSAYYYTSMSDYGVSGNTTYCYTVLANDVVGNESVLSNPPACATTP